MLMRLSADSTHNPNGTIDIIQNHLAEMIFSFGKTEGLPFTYQQTRELLFGDKADAMTWREITTILNLRDAFDFLFDNWHYPVELGTVFDYNARVGGHDLEPNAGYARENYKVIISGVDYVPDPYYGGDQGFERVIDEKLSRDIYPLGTKAGVLNARGAALTGLPQGIAVAVANIDAHVSMPPVGLTDSGNLLMILGTSTCHLMLGAEEREVPGVGGIVEDGVIPGTYGYESGQNCVGDSLKWFVDNCFPAAYAQAAKEMGLDENQYLTYLANKLKPGQSGLLALDWWNGNRSILCDYDLTGMIVGLTIASKAEEIYRALIEATAYGTRRIVDSFEENGLPVEHVFACGGISKKNAMFMQIYADVLNRDIRIARSSQTPALGSAIFGAVAAGSQAGGYDSVETAAHAMGGTSSTVYHPITENVEIYKDLYSEYLILHDYFGRGENNVMKRLRKYRD